MRLTIFLALAIAWGCRKPPPAPSSTDCASCHPAEVARFERSHHAHAQRLLGDLRLPSGRVDGFTVTSDDAGSWVEWTEDEGLERGPVRAVIGVEPVRQLVVESGNGWHVPPLGWLSDGGWTRVPGERFDWRGPAFSWNASCAPCHATQFRQGVETDGGFSSRFDSFAVSCRACHGDEGGHLRWLAKGRPADASSGFTRSLVQPRTITFLDGGVTARLGPPGRDEQLERCAGCHSRRRALVEVGEPTEPFLDRFEPSLLELGLFSAAGEVRDEVFEVGSFLQSKMHRAGVRCSDCHEPHEGTLLAPVPALCGRCHRLETFAAPSHHQHHTVSCVDCHLPTKTFLGVDVRHDHSLARPTREVCLGCHQSTLPPSPLRLRTAETFEAAFGDRVDAPRRLDALVRDDSSSAFARASALALGRGTDAARLQRLESQVRSGDDWVRYGVARALPSLGVPARLELGRPLLSDARRAVRVQAARALVGLTPVPAHLLAEAEQAERLNASRGDAWLNLSDLRARQGDALGAEAALREGLRRDPSFVPLLINLADLRRGEAVTLLEPAATTPGPFQARASYALGLALWRTKQPARARLAFAAAAREPLTEHLVGFCLAERELGGEAAGWAAWDLALTHSPGNAELLTLADGWLQRLPNPKRSAQLAAERSHWNP